MKKGKIVGFSFLSAVCVLAYVSFVVWFITHGAMAVFGQDAQKPFLIPVFMLLLFIVSACITGFLVLAKPIQLYMASARKEAVALLLSTVGWLVLFLLGIVLAVFPR